LGVLTTTCSQSWWPSLASRQSSFRSPESSMQVVTKRRSPHTTGEEWPFPARGTFQTTPSVALHFRGKPVSSEVPSRRGPRQPDHSSFAAWANAARAVKPRMMRIVGSLMFGSPLQEVLRPQGSPDFTFLGRSAQTVDTFCHSPRADGDAGVARSLHYGGHASPLVRPVQPALLRQRALHPRGHLP